MAKAKATFRGLKPATCPHCKRRMAHQGILSLHTKFKHPEHWKGAKFPRPTGNKLGRPLGFSRLGRAERVALGQTIRAMREQRGISRTDFAHRAGMTYNVLSTTELGRSWPGPPNLQAIAKLLDLSVEELVARSQAEPQPQPQHRLPPIPSVVVPALPGAPPGVAAAWEALRLAICAWAEGYRSQEGLLDQIVQQRMQGSVVSRNGLKPMRRPLAQLPESAQEV